MTAPRVLFYVQHLLGIGHLKRAATLARAMAARGMEVTVVSGGEEVPVLDSRGMSFVQLPPVRAADREFSAIVGADGAVLDDALKSSRRDRLLALLDEVAPQALMVELFPFGRRAMRFELLPLIEAARARDPRPLIVSSVRDVLVEKNRPERDAEMVQTARNLFDHVLVHGDPALIAFDVTFPLAAQLRDGLHYTGYVVEDIGAVSGDAAAGTGEVIVSAGGGRLGETLLSRAIAARPMTAARERVWRLLAGHNLPDSAFTALQASAPSGVVVERARRDFVTLLRNCALSISQGGYNTIMEVLLTGAQAVAVPYAGGHETEQTLRTRLLAERGLLQVVAESDLTPARLAAAADAALAAAPPEAGIDMDGAAATAALMAGWLAK